MSQAGKYDQRVTLQRVSKTQDSFGADVSTWSTLGSYWAKVRPLTSRELEIQQQTQAPAEFVVEMDGKRSGLNEGDIRREDRFTWGSYTLDILDARLSHQRFGTWQITARVFVQ